MAIIYFLPKISKVIPAPLAGIGIVALIVIFFGLDVPRVGDMASIKGGLPSFHVPMVELSWETFEIIFPYAVVLAAIGLIESLLTLNLVGEMTNKRGGASQECLAQGTANVVTGFFGGMGGCAMIGQSMINVKSGGRTRIAGISAAVFLLLFILVGSSIIEQIPLAALVGVMFMVVIGTFAWNSLKILRVVPKTDAFVITKASVFGTTRRILSEFQAKVPITTINITPTNAAKGICSMIELPTRIKSKRKTAADMPAIRVRPPDFTFIIDCPIIAQPPMPPKNPVTTFAVP